MGGFVVPRLAWSLATGMVTLLFLAEFGPERLEPCGLNMVCTYWVIPPLGVLAIAMGAGYFVWRYSRPSREHDGDTIRRAPAVALVSSGFGTMLAAAQAFAYAADVWPAGVACLVLHLALVPTASRVLGRADADTGAVAHGHVEAEAF